jgi:hypothetical protein
MIVGSRRTDCRVLVSGNPCARQFVDSSGQQHSSQLSGMSGSWERRGLRRISSASVLGHSAPIKHSQTIHKIGLE